MCSSNDCIADGKPDACLLFTKAICKTLVSFEKELLSAAVTNNQLFCSFKNFLGLLKTVDNEVDNNSLLMVYISRTEYETGNMVACQFFTVAN